MEDPARSEATVVFGREPDPLRKVMGPDTVIHLLATALVEHLDRLSIFPLEGLLMGAARANDKRPAYLKVATLDSVVMNMHGTPSMRDELMIVKIPREVVDKILNPPEESPIILPPGVVA